MNEDKGDELQAQIDEIKQKVKQLANRRLYQMDFTPACVKNRAMGEPNTYIFSGLASKLPASGVKLNSAGFGCSVYWAYDTHTLYVWDNAKWRSVVLT